MTLSAGQRLGPYEILSPLGAGGMGEVYRARDTRLDRTVAIKVLPSHLCRDPGLRQRFEREARAVSSLNHPHICTLHDIGSEGGVDYLVMEHVDGETLASRLDRGPLTLDELLRVGSQIADALDKAHRQGLVHRDLKPGNIMLTKSGTKLLDFGLAKNIAATSGGSGLTASPTVTGPLTAAGAIVGTFQYMAPEQIEGQEADARTDIFAFGAVLYEMATGKKAFQGKTQASLIAAILKEEPRSIAEAAPLTPPALDRLVRTCLAKDAEDRRQTMRGVLLELKWIAEGGSAPEAASVPRSRTRERVWMSAAALFFLASITLTWMYVGRTRAAGSPTVRLSIANPLADPDASFEMVQVSPDGTSVAFLAPTTEGKPGLWVRSLDSLSSSPLPGTEDAYAPFWSPDGRFLGFFAGGKLKKVAISGGPPQVLCDVPSPSGGSWSREGVIIFGGQQGGGIHRVPASGGASVPVTRLEPREESHRWPSFLPDGRHFVFLGDADRTEDHFLRLGTLDSDQSADLFNAVTNAVFAPPHYLIYVRARTLLAQRLDMGTLRPEGDPVPLGDQIAQDGENHHFGFSVSDNGLMTYRAANLDSQLTWVDRAGKRLAAIGAKGRFDQLRISPSGRWLAFAKRDEDGRVGDLWLGDLSRGTASRLTAHPGAVSTPIWSPDEAEIIFYSAHEGPARLYRKSVTNPARESLLLAWDSELICTDWSPDGRMIVFESHSEKTQSDLWILPVANPGKPEPLVQTPFAEYGARFSPDGRWIAYVSNESGQDEIYVQGFPSSSRRIQVSAGGGDDPTWRADGKEIFYVSSKGTLMAVGIAADASGLEGAPPKELFRITGGSYTAAPDGQRFLVASGVADPSTGPVTVVLNWTRGLKDR